MPMTSRPPNAFWTFQRWLIVPGLEFRHHLSAGRSDLGHDLNTGSQLAQICGESAIDGDDDHLLT